MIDMRKNISLKHIFKILFYSYPTSIALRWIFLIHLINDALLIDFINANNIEFKKYNNLFLYIEEHKK